MIKGVHAEELPLGPSALLLGASRGIYAGLAAPHHAPDAQPLASMSCRWGKGAPRTLLLVGERPARGRGASTRAPQQAPDSPPSASVRCRQGGEKCAATVDEGEGHQDPPRPAHVASCRHLIWGCRRC
jgi:hypothetical protein